jgi:hypothetical protein
MKTMILTGFGIMLLSLALLWGHAHALCESAPENGTWRNDNPGTDSITRVVIRQQCNDLILVPVDGLPPAPRPGYYVEIWGACTPTDCYWGSHPANRDSGWIRVTIKQDWVQREIWITASAPDDLRVWIWSDFTDPNRSDYTSDDYFHPELCEAPVCVVDSYCCDVIWDSICASETPTWCHEN